MQMRLSAITLAVLGGAASLAMPAKALAGNVGYHNRCPGIAGDISGVVATAGHTKVDIPTLDATSLNGLTALVITACPGGYTSNAAVNNAVANGMGLVFERIYNENSAPRQDSTQLPGAPTFGATGILARPVAHDNVDIAAGAPIATGPGGSLNDSSLDYVSGPTWYNMVYFYSSSSLPSGAIPFLTTPDSSQVGSFGYTHGSGRIAYTDSQYTLQLPGGEGAGPMSNNFAAAGATFLANAIFWVTGEIAPPATTCASEGYTGTKLNWCRIICESESSSSTVDTYLRRWINKYRDLPYCAVEGGGEEPPPSQG